MTFTYKIFSGLAAVCALGLIWALAEVVAQSPGPGAHAGGPGLSAPQPPPLRPAPAAAPDTAPNWVFTLRSDAEDDPETARSASASIVFEGAVTACQDPYPHAQFGLGVDRSGASAAHARRVQRVCLPGCEGSPPAAVTQPLARHLDLTAFQEQFDRASGEYAPEGRIASVQWECSGRATRLVAAAVVALACNSAQCDDRQVANASVYLGYDHGRSLDEAGALFALRGVDGSVVVAHTAKASASR